ncbi:hypothetical protein AUJ68_04300 [Candidatus Woesearchaeota archaeon CG1_02_57_44]|nr:MAG: hypothetical protein AUJ68_04300 [Candidatus Woesearchaeota archaeon CG1_02_57_44]
MISPKQLRILGTWCTSPFGEHSFSQLRTLLNESSHASLQTALRAFLDENLLIMRQIGPTKLYAINHQNASTHLYLQMAAADRLSAHARASIAMVKECLDSQGILYAGAVFGSYATGKQDKTSDIDLAVMVQDKVSKGKAKGAMGTAALRSPLRLDAQVMTRTELLNMLCADEANLGKEIARGNLPVFAASLFYCTIIDAMRHGFSPLPLAGGK